VRAPAAALALLALLALHPGTARAFPNQSAGDGAAQRAVVSSTHAPAALQAADVQEQLGAQVPLDTALLDEQGRRVTLAQVLSPDRPTVLSLVYYECPMLCSLVLDGLRKSLAEVGQTLGEDYQAVSLSIDPKDTPFKSAQRRRRQLAALGRPEDAPWSFLTGEQAQVQRVADAVGFRYAYDPASGQYAHPAVVMVLTPGGKVSRYLYGVQFPARDMNLALLEAGEGRVGTTLERVVLSCFKYDANAKGYAFYILGFLRIVGGLMLGALGTVMVLSWRRDRQRPSAP
jgi:protein SCO1/2